jgi:hypothetical protein
MEDDFIPLADYSVYGLHENVPNYAIYIVELNLSKINFRRINTKKEF